MCPGPDDQATGGRDVGPSLTLDAEKVFEFRRQERIVPASHQQDRSLDTSGSIVPINGGPVIITLEMPHPIVEEGKIFESTVVGFDERETFIALLKNLRWWGVVLRILADKRPIQRALE